MRFADVCLITDDVLGLARYYESILLCKAEGDATHASLALGEFGIAFYAREAAVRDMSLPIATGAGNVTLGFDVADVDAEYVRLLDLGVTFINPPTDRPWGARAMQWLDPDGNLLTFRSRIVQEDKDKTSAGSGGSEGNAPC